LLSLATPFTPEDELFKTLRTMLTLIFLQSTVVPTTVISACAGMLALALIAAAVNPLYADIIIVL
jgi:hypothetical protein